MVNTHILMSLLQLWLCSVLYEHTEAAIELRRLHEVYLPTGYDPVTGEAVYQFGMGAAEKGALDPQQSYIYAVGQNKIYVVDYTNPNSTIIRTYVQFPDNGMEGSDVTACGSWVAASAVNTNQPQLGRVYLYNTYTEEQGMVYIDTIDVGNRPDMLIFTSDCTQLLVAIEATAIIYQDGAGSTDDEGMIVTIDFLGTPDGAYTKQESDFTKFNDRYQEYVDAGVRYSYRGQGVPGFENTFSKDMEPEYITFNYDQSIAYIALQENNAIATMDMATKEITEIYPLGAKSYATSPFDASDDDTGFNLQPWDVYGLYQPDGFKYVEYNGVGYIITANEGDPREVGEDQVVWEEAKRGKDFTDDEFAPSVDVGLKAQMRTDAELGRLDFSIVDGRTEPDLTQYERFYSFGTRSFSLWRVESDGSISGQVYDSGSDMESAIGLKYSDVFNSNNNDENEFPEASRDSRSDRSGPEPESVDTGEIDGIKLIFIGCERPGFIFVYSVDDTASVPSPQFENVYYSGGFGDTYNNLYQSKSSKDLDPEGLRFIPAKGDQPPMLSVFSPVTSTVSLYEIVNTAKQH